LDNVTHTLFAATLARTSLARAGRGTTATLMLASNAPDVDVVSLVGGAIGYLEWHRGPTHGPLGIVGLGVMVAGFVWAAIRWRDRRHTGGSSAQAPSLPMLSAVGMLGVALHIGMDLPTSYGTRALSPFVDRWFTTDWMPIIDIYLLALLGAGLAVGQRTQQARRSMAMVVLLLMAANYGLRAVAHDRAVAAATEAFGPRLPAPCSSTPLTRRIGGWDHAAREAPEAPAAGRCLLEIAAIPTFMSPFRWQVIAQTSDAYEMQVVDVLSADARGRPAWRLARRHPNQWTEAVVRARESDVARRFLSFSRYPAARSRLNDDGTITVQWTDMRFTTTPLTPRASPNRRSLFSATVRIGADGAILDERLGD